ncbi:hypothetical protein KGP36_07450 [Patescibacteria group bacterium]|nr:hypothetical protein [Patescibacteria group bacterium]
MSEDGKKIRDCSRVLIDAMDACVGNKVDITPVMLISAIATAMVNYLWNNLGDVNDTSDMVKVLHVALDDLVEAAHLQNEASNDQ